MQLGLVHAQRGAEVDTSVTLLLAIQIAGVGSVAGAVVTTGTEEAVQLEFIDTHLRALYILIQIEGSTVGLGNVLAEVATASTDGPVLIALVEVSVDQISSGHVVTRLHVILSILVSLCNHITEFLGLSLHLGGAQCTGIKNTLRLGEIV